MEQQEQLKIIYFYGCYYIGNRITNEYLMIDLKNKKVKLIDEIKMNIIELLSQIKSELKNLK